MMRVWLAPGVASKYIVSEVAGVMALAQYSEAPPAIRNCTSPSTHIETKRACSLAARVHAVL